MIRIGKLVATHGIQGSLIFTHIAGKSNWLRKGDVLMVEMQKGSRIPYFIADAKAVNEREYRIKIEDLDSQAAAKSLITKHVYVDEQLLANVGVAFPLLWIGFEVTDEHYGNIGRIVDVMQTGVQWIGNIDYKGAEALIPLVDATIKRIDFKGKHIYTKLPEGLLEVYEQ